MKRILLSTIILMLCLSSAMGQASLQLYSIKGRVIDSETGSPLLRCNVALMNTDTTKMVRGAVTTEDGSFLLRFVKSGTYIVRASFVGYRNFYRKLVVTADENSHKVGTILLNPENIELKNTVVTALLKEVEVKEDTIIYNADAFKVPEGSVLEELIRKIPGFTIEDDGTIKHNGKTVKKFLVEGKDFFSSNKDMALKNLPTEIIDKVKTYDKQSDLARITGIDDGEEETVVDLTIKKGMKKGWFGNVDASYGTHDRFSEKLMANRFQDKLQATLMGSYNNIGDQTGGGGGRGGNNGITKSGQAGARLIIDKGDFEVGGSVTFNDRNNNTVSNSSAQEYNQVNNLTDMQQPMTRAGALGEMMVGNKTFSNRWSDSNSKNRSLAGDFKLEWDIDSMTTIMFRPNFSVGKTSSVSANESMSFNDDPYLNTIITDPLTQRNLIDDAIKVNESSSNNTSNGNSYNLGGNLIFNRKLGGKPWFGPSAEKGAGGRNLSVRMNGTTSGNGSKTYNYSNVIYHQRNDSSDVVFRYRNTPSSNRNYSVGLTYSEPILRNLFAQINYSYNYSKRHSDGQTYDFGADDVVGKYLWETYGVDITGKYGDYTSYLSDTMSRYTDNFNYTHNFEFSLRYITSLLNLSAGVRVEQQKQKMVYQYLGLDTVASRNISRVSPTLNARFRFDKQHTLRITYRGSTQQPNMTDMFNLTDNTNTLNVKEGNPNLKPSFTNNVGLDYNRYFTATSRSIFGRVQFSNTLNSISSRTSYDPVTGSKVTRPENINGNWNISGNIGFNTPCIWKQFTINTNSSASYRNNVSYIFQNMETYKNNVGHVSLGERLTMTLRLDAIDFRANGNITWSKNSSDVVTSSNQNVFNFHYGLSSSGNFNNGWGYSTDIGMSSRRGYSSESMNTNELIWNAQVSYRFLKNRAATVSIQAYDILHQRSNISRQVSGLESRDTETNSINSYLLCHFIYRLNLFGSREARQHLREMRQMRDMNPMGEGGEMRGGPGERGGQGGGGRGGEGGMRGGGMGGPGGF